MDNKSMAHKAELHVSHCLYPKVQKTEHVWGLKHDVVEIKETVRDETGKADRWESLQESYSHICSDSTQN